MDCRLNVVSVGKRKIATKKLSGKRFVARRLGVLVAKNGARPMGRTKSVKGACLPRASSFAQGVGAICCVIFVLRPSALRTAKTASPTVAMAAQVSIQLRMMSIRQRDRQSKRNSDRAVNIQHLFEAIHQPLCLFGHIHGFIRLIGIQPHPSRQAQTRHTLFWRPA